MKFTVADGNQEREVIIGMITSKQVLGAIATKWEPGLMESSACNLIAQWCIDYFKKYSRSPGKQIKSIYDRWASTRLSKDENVKIIGTLLASVSNKYASLKEDSNPKYVIDVAGSYFTKVKAQNLQEQLTSALEGGRVTEIKKIVNDFHEVELGLGTGYDLLRDAELLKRAFTYKSIPLIQFKGAANNFFRDIFSRDTFVSFEAPEKRGKTFNLIDLAWRAMLQKRKVAFFGAGDMMEESYLRRFVSRAVKRPIDGGILQVPIILEPPVLESRFRVEHKITEECKPVTLKEARKFLKAYGGKEHSKIKLSCHASKTLSVYGIQNILQTWERESWVPDVVIIDYADILAPINGKEATRDQVNATWAALRSLSQKLHGCVITATQTDADSYDTDIIAMDNFTEDKRKRAHVTTSVGINQTDEEKEVGLIRYNIIVDREHKFDRNKCMYAASCLGISNPMVLTAF